MPTIVANNGNAMTLWNAGLIAATNAPITANFRDLPGIDSNAVASAYRDARAKSTASVLNNIALKGGFNAIRVFMELDFNGSEHEITTLTRLGWADTTVNRQATRDWVIPTYKLLASQIDNLLSLCGSLGIGVIVVPGSFYSGANEALWSSQTLQDQLVTFWEITAKRWAQNSALIAYELINEPSPGFNGNSPMTYAAMQASGNLNNYKALAERCITAIRKWDTTTPVMVSSICGGHPDALDYFTDASVGLIKDVKVSNGTSTNINKVVYTCHFYNPSRYTHQGILPWGYHATGLCYPNLIANDFLARNGTTTRPSYDFKTASGSTNVGMDNAFAIVKKFRAAGNPVFVGEFSASSSTYLKMISENSGFPNGASNYVPRDSDARAVVGLNYDPVTQEGVLVMRGGISLYDTTETDALGRNWSTNTVNLMISPAAGQDIGNFNALGLLLGVKLSGSWYLGNNTNGDQNCLIRFKWPLGSVPAPALNQGVNHLDANGNQINPSSLLDIIKSTQPAMLASIQIVLKDDQVKAQEASRVLYARDVLRQCSAGGLSWAWFCEYETLDSYPYGDKFWQVDNVVNAATGTGGKLRALLRRAASQSYE